MKLVMTITRHSRILRPRCLTGPNACEKSLFSLLSSPRIAHPTARHSACPSQSFHVAQGLSLFLGPDAFCRESPEAFSQPALSPHIHCYPTEFSLFLFMRLRIAIQATPLFLNSCKLRGGAAVQQCSS